MKFPNMVAAADARAKHLKDAEGRDLWLLGAATLKDCGDEILTEEKTISSSKRAIKALESAAKELAKHGHEYSHITLRQMAETVLAFPASRRHEGVTFFTHTEARNPDLLDWMVKQVGKEKLSGRVARELVTRWYNLQANQRREKIEAAKDKKRAATTLEDKRAATKEIKELGSTMPTPKAFLAPPDEDNQHALAVMADVLSIDADAMSVTRTLRTNLSALRKMGEIDPDFVGSLIEHHEQIVEVAKQIVSVLKDAKRNRFTTIEGGKSA